MNEEKLREARARHEQLRQQRDQLHDSLADQLSRFRTSSLPVAPRYAELSPSGTDIVHVITTLEGPTQ